MSRSRQMLQRFRENRREIVRQLVGSRWSEEGSRSPVPVNLIALYVSIISQNLIAKSPRVLLSTFNRAAKPAVAILQDKVNKDSERIGLDNILKRVVVDALTSIGILKVALATPSDAAGLSWGLRAGEAFIAPVDLDDFVCDAHARDWSEVSFIGHRYRALLETIRDDPIYSKARKDLSASDDPAFNPEGDERIGMLGRGYGAGLTEEYEEFVDLWEIYLPRDRLIVTLPDDYLSGGAYGQEPLRVRSALCPDEGPYHILGYGTVPGNLMPKAPLQDVFDLHLDANRTYRKFIRSADRIKELLIVQGGATEDGSRVQQADDGDILRLDNPDRIKQIVTGGTTVQSLQGAAMTLKELFSYMAGNLDLLGGRSPQSKTAHQDAMLNENATRAIADMQATTIHYVSKVIKSWCWFLHHDPFRQYQAGYQPRGLPEISALRTLDPAQRQQVPFADLDIKVDPYSLAHATPQARLQALNAVVKEIYLPLAQLAQQQGVAFDFSAYLQKAAAYLDQPDLAEVLTVREPPAEQAGAGGGGAGPGVLPAETERTYNRVSLPGRTQKGDDMNKINALLGINPGGAGVNGTPQEVGT